MHRPVRFLGVTIPTFAFLACFMVVLLCVPVVVFATSSSAQGVSTSGVTPHAAPSQVDPSQVDPSDEDLLDEYPDIPGNAVMLDPAKENQAYESKQLSAKDPRGISRASIPAEDHKKLAEYNLEFVATPVGKNLYDTLPNHTLVIGESRYGLAPGTYEGYTISFRSKPGTVVLKSGAAVVKLTLAMHG